MQMSGRYLVIWQMPKGLSTEAIRHYKKALKIEPNDLNLWLTVINREAKAGEFENLKKNRKRCSTPLPITT